MEPITPKKPKTMAELLPILSSARNLTKSALQTLTAKKQPRPTMAHTRTSEKSVKPITLAEMKAITEALKVQSPKRNGQTTMQNKKRNWNSSVKVDKKISHTADGQLKNNPVRKVLYYPPKQKNVPISRATMHPLNTETPRIQKPENRAKNSIHLQARNTVRISGVFNIPETPKDHKRYNKENIANNANIKNKSKTFTSPKLHHLATKKSKKPDTPLSNESWKSSCDASFLQNERNMLYIEENIKPVSDQQSTENIADVSPPVSTPFQQYRNVTEYFNDSSQLENSALQFDNTITVFDKPTNCKEETFREESVIVTLCELFNKTKVTDKNTDNKLEDLLEDLLLLEKQTESRIKLIENGIQLLSNLKESQLNELKNVQKLISKKRNRESIQRAQEKITIPSILTTKPVGSKSPILGKSCSVIKSPIKSPSYKIPKKNLGLRKKVLYKSMPNIQKDTEDKALSMYLKMKEQMNFLNTPVIKHTTNRLIGCPDTPAVTSQNLQRQLDSLYHES